MMDEVTRTVEKMKPIPERYQLKASNLKEFKEIGVRCGGVVEALYEVAVKAYAYGFEKGHRATKNGKY